MENDRKSGRFRIKLTRCYCILLLICLLLPLVMGIAVADAGPKPTTTVHLKNMPGQAFIMALLQRDEEFIWEEMIYDYGEPYLKGEPEAVQQLKEYNVDGWRMHVTPSTFNYSYLRSWASNEFCFGYWVPDYFRVIIIELDGAVHLSDPVRKSQYNAVFEYDVATGEITENKAESVRRYAKSVAFTYIITIAVEGLVLWAFGFGTRKKNWLHFMIINTVTQIQLNLLLVNEFWNWGGGGSGFFFELLIVEGMIMVAEAVYYAIFLRREEKRCVRRSILYAIAANLASVIIGFVLYDMLWGKLMVPKIF